jgi:hypothetical protein
MTVHDRSAPHVGQMRSSASVPLGSRTLKT